MDCHTRSTCWETHIVTTTRLDIDTRPSGSDTARNIGAFADVHWSRCRGCPAHSAASACWSNGK